MNKAPGRSGVPARTLVLIVGAVLVTAAVVGTVLLTRDPSRPSSEASPASNPSGAASTPTASSAPASAPPTPKPSVPSPTASGKPTVVPTQPVETTRAPLRDTAELPSGVDVTVSNIDSVEGEARGLGEVAGPALRITVRVQNTTNKPVQMEMALVNLYYGGGRNPAAALSGPGVSPFGPVVPPGSTADGRYVFSVPQNERQQLEVEFSYSTEVPTVIFAGSA